MTGFLPNRGADKNPSLATLIAAAQSEGKPVLLPGCYDALGARLIEQAGFDGVYMTGFGSTASLLGRPDVGLLTMSEMVTNASRIVSATSLPVLADADTGYGNAINVARTVQAYEQIGVGGIHIEDQVLPKKCGHMEDKAVVETAEMVGKIETAVAARNSDEFVIIARTDARAPNGLADAIDRGHRFRDAGADVLFIEALEGRAEIEQVAVEFNQTPLLFNWVEGGKTPPLTHQEISDLGFAIILMPIGMLLAATQAMRDYLGRVQDDGTPANVSEELLGFGEFTDLVGLPEIREIESRFEAR